MNPELRERLAKVAYNASREVCGWDLTWDEIDESEVREVYRVEAEAVALALVEMIMPAFQLCMVALTGSQVEVQLERNEAHES